MSPDEPFIEKPDVHKPEPDTLFCYKDASRPCASDCVAYLVSRPDGKDYENQAWSQCALLVNAHRTGKHLTILAQQGADLLKHLRIKSADAVREANNPTFNPTTGKVG